MNTPLYIVHVYTAVHVLNGVIQLLTFSQLINLLTQVIEGERERMKGQTSVWSIKPRRLANQCTKQQAITLDKVCLSILPYVLSVVVGEYANLALTATLNQNPFGRLPETPLYSGGAKMGALPYSLIIRHIHLYLYRKKTKKMCFNSRATIISTPLVHFIQNAVWKAIQRSHTTSHPQYKYFWCFFEPQEHWVKLHVQPSSPRQSACNYMRL